MKLAVVCIISFVVLACTKPPSNQGVKPAAAATPTKQSEASNAKTKLEAFQANHGVVIVQGFSQVASLKAQYGGFVLIEAKEFTNVASGSRESGITIQVKETLGLVRENTSYVDYDEIDSLLKGLDYIVKIDKSVTKLDNFQADYRTKGDLVLACFSHKDRTMLEVKSGQIGGTKAYFDLSDAPKLRSSIAKAKATLDGLR